MEIFLDVRIFSLPLPSATLLFSYRPLTKGMKYTTLSNNTKMTGNYYAAGSWTIWHHSLHSVLTTADNTDSAEGRSQSEPSQGEGGPIRGRQMSRACAQTTKLGV